MSKIHCPSTNRPIPPCPRSTLKLPLPMSLAPLAALAIGLVAAPAAWAARTVTALSFEGLTVPNGLVRAPVYVADYYDGGASRTAGGEIAVQAPEGADVDVRFDTSAWAVENLGNGGPGPFNAPRLNEPDGVRIPELGTAALSFAQPTTGELGQSLVQVGGGFTGALSFYYAYLGNSQVTVDVWSGANGSGALLASIPLESTSTCPTDGNVYCVWLLGSQSFTQRAGSIRVSGYNGELYLDNFTLGSATPLARSVFDDAGNGNGNNGGTPVTPAVPEPGTWAMLLLALGAAFGLARRRAAA